MSARGDRTREHLLDVAERLMGDRGVGRVSLREIRIDAGQANVGALHYHFGDHEGLLRAVVERHLPRLQLRHEELLSELAPAARPASRRVADVRLARSEDVRRLLTVIIRPYADYLELGPSERSWVKINADLLRHPKIGLDDLEVHSSGPVLATGIALFEHLSADFPPDIATERIVQVLTSAANGCADRARLVDTVEVKRRRVSHEMFAINLLDMSCGALLAPISESLRATSGSRARTRDAHPRRSTA